MPCTVVVGAQWGDEGKGKIVDKLDVLDAFEEIRVVTGYERDGQPVAGFPAAASALERCRPLWRSFTGWHSPTSAARRWADLPGGARSYLEWLEHENGVPITAVSVGSEREAQVPRT
jgi:adenylosuccinate synthase